eukprot:SAG22_NODE_366_length_11615_cov_13.379125_10_plen_581_part_00
MSLSSTPSLLAMGLGRKKPQKGPELISKARTLNPMLLDEDSDDSDLSDLEHELEDLERELHDLEDEEEEEEEEEEEDEKRERKTHEHDRADYEEAEKKAVQAKSQRSNGEVMDRVTSGNLKFSDLGTVGSAFGQLYIFVSFLQNLSLLISAKIDWPHHFSSIMDWLKFFTFAWTYVFPSLASDGAMFVCTLLVHPLIIVYAVSSYMSLGGELDVGFINNNDVELSELKNTWIRKHTNDSEHHMGVWSGRWNTTRLRCLLWWIVPSTLVFVFTGLFVFSGVPMAFAVSNGMQEPATFCLNQCGSHCCDPVDNSTAAGTADGSYTDSSQESEAEVKPTFVDILAFFGMLWFMFGLFPLAYKELRRKMYFGARNARANMNEEFWGKWAGYEGDILLFAYITTYVPGVAVCIGWIEVGLIEAPVLCALSVVLLPFYTLVPPAVLLRSAKSYNDVVREVIGDADPEDLEDMTDREIDELLHQKTLSYGDSDSFTSAYFTLIEPFEDKFWWFKPYVSVQHARRAGRLLSIQRIQSSLVLVFSVFADAARALHSGGAGPGDAELRGRRLLRIDPDLFRRHKAVLDRK